MVKIDIRSALADLKKLSATLSKREIERATRMALNDTVKRGRTRMVSLVQDNYNEAAFTSSAIKAGTLTKPATTSNLEASIWVSRKPLPIRLFRPRQTEAGISVGIYKGKRKIIRGAFFVKVQGGKVRQVVARGKYEGNKFSFRTRREKTTGSDLPITSMLTTSLHGAIVSRKGPVMKGLEAHLRNTLPTRLEHYLKQITKGVIS
jgi:hypothetical protein